VEPAVELHHQAEVPVRDIGELVVHPALAGAHRDIVTAFDVAQIPDLQQRMRPGRD
jgi:hypothetical protein